MNEIENLEIEILKGNFRKDSEKLDELLSDDFIEFGGSGVEYSKEQIIEALLCENNIEWNYRDMKSRTISDDLIMVNYFAIKKEGENETESLRTSIWKKTGDNYRMIFHQVTNI